MIKSIAAIIIAAVLVIAGLSVYLGPNDLAQCPPKPSQAKGCSKVDAIMAISGGDTAARAREAIALYQEGWSDKIIFSGAAQDKTGPSNAVAMRRQAVSDGVPESAVLTEGNSATTRQNAEQAQALFKENNIHTVILVTSAYHQRRASLEFNKRTGGTVEILNHPVPQDNQWSRLWWLTPGGWWLAVSEFFKIIGFYMGVSQ
jgi:uncharacterized SAM-binding protein YcdF (DUF218 family)